MECEDLGSGWEITLFVGQLCKYEIEVAGLCEVRWGGAGEQMVDGYKLLYSGRDDGQRQQGVGLVLSPKAAKALMYSRPVDERIMMARLGGRHANVSVVVAYAPTEDADEMVISSVPSHDRLIVLGDFNASLGKDRMFLKTVIGSSCDAKITNDNGHRLIDLASQAGLIVTNTLFPHKYIHTWTWMPPSRTGRGAVKDYILVDEGSRNSVHDVRVYRGAEIDSDHNLLVMKYSLSLRAHGKPMKGGDRRVVKALADEKMVGV